jgi:hypothetical protein
MMCNNIYIDTHTYLSQVQQGKESFCFAFGSCDDDDDDDDDDDEDVEYGQLIAFKEER